jgi:2-polyprenyl-3-methyl-5-hydroxy-6-metoxy-1,4-benzoquinol methylase
VLKEATVTEACTCPICDATDSEPRFRVPFPNQHHSLRQGFTLDENPGVPFWTIDRCNNCGLEYAKPRPTKAEIHSFYKSQFEPNEWEKEVYLDRERTAAFRDLAQGITALNGGPGRVLEIGSAGGWFLKAAQELGWQVNGVEASPKFSKFCIEHNKIPVVEGTSEDVPTEFYGQFDIVAMFDVLEHLQDPLSELKRLHRLVKPGGHIIIATCDIGSACARTYGVNWRQIVVSHTIYWTKKSMRLAMAKAGFSEVTFSEPRYWHPQPAIEMNNKIREVCKLLSRVILFNTYVPLSKLPVIRQAPSVMTAGKLTHDRLLQKIGDQPVLGDVMLVIAKK